MGARAHGRRREGRAIRKDRRVWREWITTFGRLREAARTAEMVLRSAEVTFEEFGKSFVGAARQIQSRQQPTGAAIATAEVGVPYPTQSGVKDAREAARRSEVSERVDASAARLGLELLPWQRQLAINTLLGTSIVSHGGRSAGRTTVQNVVRGIDADVAWVDEAAAL